MNLLLLRHGDALSVGFEDADRPLSTLGEEQALLAARTLQRFDAIPRLIVSSPYVRAVKTAELVSSELQVGNVQVSDHLLPGADRDRTLSLLTTNPADRILLVGHEPHLRILLAFLVGASEASGIALRKGALASLDLQIASGRGMGVLRWLMTSDEMEAIT